jgi:class 3 adenylate cyclase
MFSDIEDSTELLARMGDADWLDLVGAHNAKVREQLRRHGGHEVKSQGDGFMIAFASTRAALECAADIQRAIQAIGDVRVRIGLHRDEVLHHEEDFYGLGVVFAARLADQAQGSEILVSEEVRGKAPNEPAFGPARELDLKGVPGTQRAYPLTWR